MAASLCRRFTLGDRAWEIDLMTLSINDAIGLQQIAGRTWAQIIAGLDEGDAVVTKVVWWAARRASGEDISIDADEMNPRWADFTSRPVERLSAVTEAISPEPAKSAAKRPPAKKR